ncbi:MAG: GAF domain-containing protein [Candidatus Pacearchaeota archaeon]|nr:GAF domain-containing protein [Candidatus Pacearchaeota archaeon]
MDSESKEKLYVEATEEIKRRIAPLEKGNIIPRMATISAVLKDKMPYYFWCGFYFAEEEELIAGPYQGPSACPNISYSGVCGASAKKKESIVVPDVHKFPGHVVCDVRSQSEIVVPLLDDKNRIIAVFDVDSSELNAFDEVDRKYLEQIMPLLLEGEFS